MSRYLPLPEDDAELAALMTEYVRRYWEPRELPAYEADLVSRLNWEDPEEFGFFLEAHSRDFEVVAYDRVYLDTLTIRDLCKYARAKAWPRC